MAEEKLVKVASIDDMLMLINAFTYPPHNSVAELTKRLKKERYNVREKELSHFLIYGYDGVNLHQKHPIFINSNGPFFCDNSPAPSGMTNRQRLEDFAEAYLNGFGVAKKYGIVSPYTVITYPQALGLVEGVFSDLGAKVERMERLKKVA